MADNTVTIEQLPLAVSLDGTEQLPIAVFNGVGGYETKRTTTGAVTALGIDAEFVLASANPILPNSRILAGAADQISITDGGSGENITVGLAATGVTAGTYGDGMHVSQIAVDAEGRITAASSVAIANEGTVTGVGLALPAEFTVSGSPVISAGTLTAVWGAQDANKVLAGPPTGGATTPTFRSLVDADLPGGTTGSGAVVLAQGASIDLSAATALPIAGGGTQTPAGSLSIVTTAGPFAVTNEDWLVLNKGSASATTINLPAVASRAGRPLRVTDWGGNAGDITINADGGDSGGIMGLPTAVVASGGQGVGPAANLTLSPSADLTGWVIANGPSLDLAYATNLPIAGGGTQTPAGSLSIVTTAGPFAVTNEDWLVLNKGSASATTINLPAVASRAGRPLRVTDWGGNAGDITINADGGDSGGIMGLPTAVVASGGQGVGPAANLTLSPSADLTGWVIANGPSLDLAYATNLPIAGGGTQTPAGSLSIVTTAGPFAVTNEDWLVLNKGSASATTINLPAVASRAGRPLRVTDWGGNAGDITINADGGDSGGIMGLPTAVVASGGQGVGPAANLTLSPSADLTGWVIANGPSLDLAYATNLPIGALDTYAIGATTDIASLRVPAAVNAISSDGYYAAGDFGAGLWKRISTPSPAQPWQTQSADGAWWQLSPESFVNPRALGAKGDGANDDTVSCQAAIDLAISLNMEVYFPSGTFLVGTSAKGYGLQLAAPVALRGPERGTVSTPTATVKLNAGVNGNVIQSTGFLNYPTIRDLAIDGNSANNTAGSGVALNNRGMNLRNLYIQNCVEHGLVTTNSSQSGTGASSGYTVDTVIISNVGKDGWNFGGFSDAHVINTVVVDCGQSADNTYFGVNILSGNQNGRFFNLHVWHTSGATNRAAACVNSFGGSQYTACHLEGCRSALVLNGQLDLFVACDIYAPFNAAAGTAQVLILANFNLFVACNFNSTSAAVQGCAIQFGNTGASVSNNQVIACQFVGSGYTTYTPFNFAYSAGVNEIRACIGFVSSGGATAFGGTVGASDYVEYHQTGTTINYNKPWPYISASSDSTAATAGVPIGGLYYNSTIGALRPRQS